MVEGCRRNHQGSKALDNDLRLKRQIAIKRGVARAVLLAERILPRLLAPLGIFALLLAVSWLGLFRVLPDAARWPLVFMLVFSILASALPLLRLRMPSRAEADRLLEQRNRLPHQPVAVQEDEPAFDTPFAKALWHEHQRRMAARIASLHTGLPQPDIASFDRHALRAVPALLFAVAFVYSSSNGAGRLADAFRLQSSAADGTDLRIDAWITPPPYTGRAPVFLTSRNGTGEANAPMQISVPEQSVLTVRLSGDTSVTADYQGESGPATPLRDAAESAKAGGATASSQPSSPIAARALGLTLTQSGRLSVGDRHWPITVTPDQAPTIAFDGMPKRAVNGALEIGFIARDDYGLQEARAEIVPLETDASARPLYPLPEFKLDLPRRNAREVKGTSSRNLTEHPLAGKKVRITLIVKDGAGHEGRSPSHDMVLPARPFSEPLAAAVAEERQVFALDTRKMPEAIALNEALTLRADETIPNLTHYLLIEAARARMKMADNDEKMKDTADYLWEIALGIDDGDVSLAERKLADAQKRLSEALERNAPDSEIQKLMAQLRQAMQDYMKALAERQQPQNGRPQQNAQKMLTERDLQNMMNQIENLARSGNKDAAREMLQQLQQMMNNLQAGRPQRGTPQQQQQSSRTRQEIDKLGKLMQEQQKLMDETFRLDQALKDQMQRGDPTLPGDDEDPLQQMPPMGQQGNQGAPQDQRSTEDLKQALKQLRERQDGLGKQLKELQEGLKGLGIKPNEGFGRADREMKGAGEALGRSQGSRAVEGQGRALEALRQGARDMMNQMMQAMRQQGRGQQQQGMGENNPEGQDPLGRPRANGGPDFGERVKVPDEFDVERAREILDAIREKLGDTSSPEVERRYLERLLDNQ
ncbi:TIGR02302 family protein [Allorhizobium undicola]|uniref:TIGR02302 family protein n=1 Tax=Allorhizobium undicola TaxID=78527 RepID=UPI000AF386FB|nr:TIGR02302 family protein [Allorhizobium undicola]